jgi:antitoxin component of MazEF toxin-antitoxin module
MKTDIVKVGKSQAIVIPQHMQHLFKNADSVHVELLDGMLMISQNEDNVKIVSRQLLKDDLATEELLTDLSNELS